jgi:hypothetical protein
MLRYGPQCAESHALRQPGTIVPFCVRSMDSGQVMCSRLFSEMLLLLPGEYLSLQARAQKPSRLHYQRPKHSQGFILFFSCFIYYPVVIAASVSIFSQQEEKFLDLNLCSSASLSLLKLTGLLPVGLHLLRRVPCNIFS